MISTMMCEKTLYMCKTDFRCNRLHFIYACSFGTLLFHPVWITTILHVQGKENIFWITFFRTVEINRIFYRCLNFQKIFFKKFDSNRQKYYHS